MCLQWVDEICNFSMRKLDCRTERDPWNSSSFSVDGRQFSKFISIPLSISSFDHKKVQIATHWSEMWGKIISNELEQFCWDPLIASFCRDSSRAQIQQIRLMKLNESLKKRNYWHSFVNLSISSVGPTRNGRNPFSISPGLAIKKWNVRGLLALNFSAV